MNYIAFLIFIGALWGGGEIIIWDFLKSMGVPTKSPFVFAYGIFLLAFARTMYNKKGSSLAIAFIASSFKFLNNPFFICQLIAVIIEGIFFEIGYPLFKRVKKLLIPLFATYFSYAGFALSAVYILKVKGWVQRGTEGIIHYIFVNGSYALVISFITFAIGIIIGESIKSLTYTKSFKEKYTVNFIISILTFLFLFLYTNNIK